MPRTSSKRCQPRLENLEQRQVLSALPTGQEQYMLELINEARTNPAAAAQRINGTIDEQTKDTLDHYNVDLESALGQIASTPKRAPVGWDVDLAEAADKHTSDLIRRNTQSHYGPNGENLSDRLESAGYDDYQSAAENVFSKARSVDNAMQAFLIDWNNPGQGHRQNIQQMDRSQDSHTEVGLAVQAMPTTNWNPFLGGRDASSADSRYTVTQVFGRPDSPSPMVLGVVYNDVSNNDFYNEGEGVGNASIRLVDSRTGQQYTTSSWSSGGYQIEVPAGSYVVHATVNGRDLQPVRVNVGGENVKVDFDLSRTPAISSPRPSSASLAATSAPQATPTPRAQMVSSTTQTIQQAINEDSNENGSLPELPRNISLLIRYRAAVSRRFLQTSVELVQNTNSTTTPRFSNVRFWKA